MLQRPRSGRGSAGLVLCCASATLVGCGGGAPLMHPAHTLKPNQISFGAGVSGNFATGELDESIDSANEITGRGGAVVSDEDEEAFVRGAVSDTLIAPGIAPWVGARAGVAEHSDAGLTYTGRSVRVDGRYAFEARQWALSIGGGASGVLTRPGSETPTEQGAGPGPDASIESDAITGLNANNVSGYGFDVPVLAGWRSTGDVVRAWLGARGGIERLSGEILLQIDTDRVVDTADFEGDRWYVGGLAGFAIGLFPVWVTVEVSVAYQQASGSIARVNPTTSETDRTTGSVEGLTFAPAAALLTQF